MSNPSSIRNSTSTELQRRFQALASSIAAMGTAAAGLVSALEPGYLPEPVLEDILAKTRPLTAAIQAMRAEAGAFQDYATEVCEATTMRLSNYDGRWEELSVGRKDN